MIKLEYSLKLHGKKWTMLDGMTENIDPSAFAKEQYKLIQHDHKMFKCNYRPLGRDITNEIEQILANLGYD